MSQAKLQWHTETRLIEDLKAHPKNPRSISKDQLDELKESLDNFNYVEIAAINLDGTIVAGHMRIRAMIALGMDKDPIEIRVPNRQLTEKEADQYLIRSNKNTGDWDDEILGNLWNPQDLIDWGFTKEELKCDPQVIANLDGENETLEPGKDEDAITKLGDVYEMDRHRIVCGDSTDPAVVGMVLEQNTPILMVTDPPYGVEYDPSWRSGAGKGQRAAGKVRNDSQVNWALAWHLFPGSVAYVWHAGKYASEVQKSLEDAEFEIVSQIIWVKQHFALSCGDYHWQHEPMFYAVKKGHVHNWQGARDQSTTWEISNLNAFGRNQDDERTAHSTQKPLECMLRPITNNTAVGESIYDPFLGSGTSLIAADSIDRICYGIELSPSYVDIAVKRWITYRKKIGKDYMVKKNGQITEEFNG